MRTLPGRLRHVPLRLKLMAGVVAVTLVALAAFDVVMVTSMRHYLLSQTDDNLHLAVTVTEPRLNSLVSKGLPLGAMPRNPLPSLPRNPPRPCHGIRPRPCHGIRSSGISISHSYPCAALRSCWS